MSVSTTELPTDILGTKRAHPSTSANTQKRPRVLQDIGRPPTPPYQARAFPYDNMNNSNGGLLCLTPLRIQGWRKVRALEMLDDRELVTVVLEIERRYQKLVRFEQEEIERARRLMKSRNEVKKNLYCTAAWENA